MLDPDYLEQAGERVASVYSQIEADMLDYLVGRMIAGDVAGQRAQTAINLIAQSAAGPLMEIIAKRESEIDAAVKVEVMEALRRSDADDLARIKRGMGVELPGIAARQIAATVAGAEAILARQNLLMAESARNAFLQQSTWAITQVNTGAMTTERALHAAVRRLEREGISLVTYRNASTGMQTVQNKVDVAVRRHIRTQIAQDGMRLTEARMDAAGVDLVEVSSHGGARPSHARWEGRVYSRNGDKVIDGVLYRDFRTACNWGDVADGIGGANCRHSYAAWFPGMERTYRPNPEHPSGKTNAEVYELAQKQRAVERAIRQTKRELSGAQKLYESTGSAESLGDVSRLRIKLRGQQEAVRKLVNDNPKVLQRSPRREWAGDMPKVTVPKASGRKVDEFLSGEAASKALKAKGASKKAAKEALAEAMKERGGTLKDFAALTAGEQRSMFRRIMDKLDGTAKANRGKHADAFAKLGSSQEAAAELSRRLNIPVSMDGWDVEIAKPVASKLSQLFEKYRPQLVEIQTNRIGGLTYARVVRIGTDTHSIMEFDSKTLASLPSVRRSYARDCEKDYEGWRFHPKGTDEHAGIAIAVHEFAHTLSNYRQSKVIGIHADFWKDVAGVRNRYRRELREINKKLIVLREISDEEAAEMRDRIAISKYEYEEKDNPYDEFLAEAFCMAELSDSPSPYALEVLDIIKKHFGKE